MKQINDYDDVEAEESEHSEMSAVDEKDFPEEHEHLQDKSGDEEEKRIHLEV